MHMLYRAAGLFVALSGSPALASEELRPLSELHSRDLDGMLYFMKRCAAVSIVMHPKIQTHNPETAAFLMVKYNRFMEVAFNLVVAIGERDGGFSQKAANQITDDTLAMATLYEQSMSDSYIREGKMLTALVSEDTEVCGYVYGNVLNK